MTPAGLAALKAQLRQDEGVRSRAYQDGGGVWTIGVGHTGPEVRAGLVWSDVQIDTALSADIHKALDGCARYISCWGRLDDARQIVLASMAFNMGVQGLLKWRHMLADVEDGDYARAAANMRGTELWRSQVGARADRLAALMESGIHPDNTPTNFGAAATVAALRA